MLSVEPMLVALAVPRDRLPSRLAAAVDEVVRPVQPVFGVLYGRVPDFLHLILRDLGMFAEVLDAMSEAVDIGAGGFQHPLERTYCSDDLAIVIRGQQAD